VSDTHFEVACVNSALYNVTDMTVQVRALITYMYVNILPVQQVAPCYVAQIMCSSANTKLFLCLNDGLWQQELRRCGDKRSHIPNFSI
jgi:hypothetical protein